MNSNPGKFLFLCVLLIWTGIKRKLAIRLPVGLAIPGTGSFSPIRKGSLRSFTVETSKQLLTCIQLKVSITMKTNIQKWLRVWVSTLFQGNLFLSKLQIKNSHRLILKFFIVHWKNKGSISGGSIGSKAVAQKLLG